MLAAKRFTSHSHGPGAVSSKSLTSKTSLRSEAANPPKFAIWASPHACTRNPVEGVVTRSAAMTSALPRKKANGEALMRSRRSPTR